MSTSEERNRMIYKEIKANLGPCMITFSIPLLIPGITLTLVALGDEPSVPMYGALHILGIFILVLAVIMFIVGCVFKSSFKTIRISPVEEIHHVVSTHEKLDKKIHKSVKNTRKILVVQKSPSQCDIRDIYQNNNNNHLSQPSTSSSHNNNNINNDINNANNNNNSNNNNSASCDSSSSSGSLVTRTDSRSSHHSAENQICDNIYNQNKVASEQYLKDNDNKPDPYPLGRLPSLDLKHTKFSYSSQDKPDEEMSIVDETNCASPDIQPTNKSHLGDLPDINQERQRVLLSDRSYDNTSYTSTDSITGHIIRTNREEYLERESEHFAY